MTVNAILARDLDGGIGLKNELPWERNPKDMKWFRDHTLGHVVVMGRSTWESLGSKPLPGRTNVVITTKQLEGPDHTDSGHMQFVLQRLKDKYPGRYIWVIGGADIYSQALQFCDGLYLTTFNRHYETDRSVSFDPEKEFPVCRHKKEDGLLTFEIRGKK